MELSDTVAELIATVKAPSMMTSSPACGATPPLHLVGSSQLPPALLIQVRTHLLRLDARRELRRVVAAAGGGRGHRQAAAGREERQRHVAVGVGGHRRRAQERLPFAVAGRAAGFAAEILDPEGRARRAVQRAVHAGLSGRQHRVVLQVVRAGVAIAGIVGVHAGAAEIDAETAVVAEKRVAEDPIAGA